MNKHDEKCKCNHEHDEDCGCEHDHNNGDCGCGHEHHDGDCGCGHDHEHEEVEVMYITLDDDTELECYVLGNFEVEDIEYIALVPDNDDRVLLYRYKEVDGEIELENIESDDEFEIATEAFYELFGNDEEED
ncbi:DUF1292 domain-containing protein [Dethiothermospora halolimnae]|uniref:DUF1292 domain-containing protein n=1 Tax=Dethiothermospora halolimnae TaxID=3114390 RepID=UPI003CCC4243